jgi:hypothetical protein
MAEFLLQRNVPGNRETMEKPLLLSRSGTGKDRLSDFLVWETR